MANQMHQYMSMLSGDTQREVGNFYGMGGYGQSYDPNNPYSG